MNKRGDIMLFLAVAMAWACVVALIAEHEANHPSPPAIDVQSIVDRAIKENRK